MKKFIKPFLLVIFYYISFLSGIILVIIYLLATHYDDFVFESPDDDFGKNYTEMISPYVWLVISVMGLMLLAFAYFLRMTNFKHAFDYKYIDWKNVWIPIIGSIMGSYAVVTLRDLLNVPQFLPFGDKEGDISFASFYSRLFVAFVFPVIMDLTYVEAIIRYMYSKGSTALQVILYSSFCYSMSALLSPGEIMYAFMSCVISSVLYVKTGSILLNVICCFISFIFACLVPDYLNDKTVFPMSYCLILVALLTPPAIFLLWKFWKTPLPDGRHLPFEPEKVENES